MSYLDSEFYQPLFEAIATEDQAQIQAAAATFNAADLAEFVEEHPDNGEGVRLLRALTTEHSAKVFGYIGPNTQTLIAELLPTRDLAELVTAMPSDERADFFNLLDENRQHRHAPGRSGPTDITLRLAGTANSGSGRTAGGHRHLR